MKEYTVHPLAVGINETDQGIMTYLKGYGKRILLPIYVFLIRGGEKNILVDTGLEDFMVPPGAEQSLGFPVLEFEDALAQWDMEPKDVDLIIHTHLHNDHCENDYKCENAKIVVQKKEHDFLLDPHPLDHRYFPDILDGLDVVEVDGDREIEDGIGLVYSPGHTVGGQSVSVNTAQGKAVITGFCCNEENFPESGPAVTPGVHIDARDAYDSARKIKEQADILIPLHGLWVGTKNTIP